MFSKGLKQPKEYFTIKKRCPLMDAMLPSEADHDCFDEDDGLHVVPQATAGLLEMSMAGR